MGEFPVLGRLAVPPPIAGYTDPNAGSWPDREKPVSPELQQQARYLFAIARDLPTAARREFLQAQTGVSREVLAEVDRLLAAYNQASSSRTTSPDPDRYIGRYRIERELGRGGMGVVYQATDPVINRQVALKLILPGNPMFGDDRMHHDGLLREARAAGPLHHPGIVTIYDVGEAEGVPFVAMEFVDGPSLFSLMSKRRLERSRAIDILRQLASALDYAHAHGIIHRDIKPANVLLEGGAIAKIADFGIARIAAARTGALTAMGFGTAWYMSPEQIQSRDLDGRSDQFALAAMAYEMLTGAVPFTGESPTSISYKIVHEPRPLAHSANPDLPPAVDSVLARGLARQRDERFPNCAAFVEALDASLAKPKSISIGKPMPPPEAPGWRAARLPLAAFGAVMLLTVAGIAVYRKRPPVPPVPAPTPVQKPSAELPRVITPEKPVPVLPTPAPAEPVAPPPRKSRPPVVAERPKELPPAQPANPPANPPAAPPPQPGPIYDQALADQRGGRGADAAREFRQAADLGDARAMTELAKLYRYGGDGVPRDTAQAVQWFTRAADAGNASAMVYLGSMYAAGDGVLKRPGEALKWFHQAADAGNNVAMDALGLMYFTGNGVVKDEKQAVEWFQKSAAKGNAAALYDLAIAYESGRGVKQDSATALNLFRQAAAAGDKRAKARINP
jgi:serine/threonine-protein kinase